MGGTLGSTGFDVIYEHMQAMKDVWVDLPVRVSCLAGSKGSPPLPRRSGRCTSSVVLSYAGGASTGWYAGGGSDGGAEGSRCHGASAPVWDVAHVREAPQAQRQRRRGEAVHVLLHHLLHLYFYQRKYQRQQGNKRSRLGPRSVHASRCKL